MTQQTSFFTWHTNLWCCITTPSLTTKGFVIKETLSSWTHINWNFELSLWLWTQQQSSIFTIKTLACDDLPSKFGCKRIISSKDTVQRVMVWISDPEPSVCPGTGNPVFLQTVQLMMMHHHTKSAYKKKKKKKFCSSADIIQTIIIIKPIYMDRQPLQFQCNPPTSLQGRKRIKRKKAAYSCSGVITHTHTHTHTHTLGSGLSTRRGSNQHSHQFITISDQVTTVQLMGGKKQQNVQTWTAAVTLHLPLSLSLSDTHTLVLPRCIILINFLECKGKTQIT